jgi:predicted Zn finger-like uncharacterized protein
MIIDCKKCSTSFNLDESLLKPTGSKVRCSKCEEVFVAYPPTPPDELDLSEIEEMLDDAEAPAAEDTAEAAVEELDLDLDFDLEPEPEKAVEDVALDAEPDESDELDLSEIEEMLDDAEAPAAEDTAEAAVEDLDLDLDFDLEPEPEKPAEDVPQEVKLDEPDEIDLSEIEKMLDEVEATDAEDEAEIEEVDLALDMEIEPELDTAPGDVEAGVEPEGVEEADLSEIEKMLEVKEEEPDDFDFELDFDDKPAEAALPEDEPGVEIIEFDGLDDVEDAIAADELTETLEFETDISDQDELGADEETADPFYVETQVLDRAQIEEPEPDVAVEEEKPTPPKPVKKKRISKPILILLILVLLAGISYGVYTVLNFMNIEIPYISEYLNPEAKDPAGKLKLATFDINSKFVENTKIGKLFIITGKVRNDYPGIRNFISVKGTLFTTGKKIAKTETVFSGNIISDIELSSLDLAAIKKRLLNRVGDNGSNIQVKPGKVLPFMIVFTGFPENLEEFAVEAAGSNS